MVLGMLTGELVQNSLVKGTQGGANIPFKRRYLMMFISMTSTEDMFSLKIIDYKQLNVY